MAADDRWTPDFILEFLDVLERHGYHHHDTLHTSRTVGLLRNLAHIYEGTHETHASPYAAAMPSDPQPETGPPGPQSDRDAVIVSATDTGIIAAALDEAADSQRDRAETCADCTDRSCPTCQWRLRGAETYSHLATQILQAAEASRAAPRRQPTPDGAYPAVSQPQTAADKEAGH